MLDGPTVVGIVFFVGLQNSSTEKYTIPMDPLPPCEKVIGDTVV